MKHSYPIGTTPADLEEYKVDIKLLRSISPVASELKDPICHSDECQIGSFSSEATIWGL